MKLDPDDYRGALASAHNLAVEWIASVPERPVAPSKNVDEMVAAFGPHCSTGPPTLSPSWKNLRPSPNPG